MKTRFLVEESMQALTHNLLRSFLTVIGIVVGIFSVTAMLALGAGLSANVLDRLSSFATGDLTVTGKLTMQDVGWVASRPYVAHTLSTQSLASQQVVAFGSTFSPQLQTVYGDYNDIQKNTVVAGTTFDYASSSYSQPVVVVSDGFVTKVKESTGQDVVGQYITIGTTQVKVIGEITSQSMTFTRGDGIILVPYGFALGNFSSSPSFASDAVKLTDSSLYDIAGQDIVAGLNASRQLTATSSDLFNVQTAQSFIQTAQQTTQMISLFLGIVGGIALFVGGIGTMNMMLTTVTERTREIGLRKAVGARNRDILLQILIESVALTTFGGFIGILITFGAAALVNKIAGSSGAIHVIMNTQVVVLAFFVAVAVGVVFGLYPARSASKLQPVDALRAE